MISVLHLRSSNGLYGADHALLTLASETRAPFQPVVATLVRPARPDPLGAEAKRRGLAVLALPSPARADSRSARAVARFCRDQAIGLVHAHDYKSLAVAALAGFVTGVPLVATYHGDTGATLPLRAYEAFARGLGNFTDGVAAVSRPAWSRLCRWVRAAPVVYIPNGVPAGEPCNDDERALARAQLGIAPDDWVVAAIGRLSVEKGHRVLVDALGSMARPPLTLFAGDGPLRAELEGACRDLPVRFLGFVANARAIYAACDLVVLPSLTEGLPMVALEALSYGRALLATAVGELPQVLSGGAGRLVPAGDARALAVALEELTQSRGALGELAAVGRFRVVARYSARAMAQAYAETLYLPALRGRAPSGLPSRDAASASPPDLRCQRLRRSEAAPRAWEEPASQL